MTRLPALLSVLASLLAAVLPARAADERLWPVGQRSLPAAPLALEQTGEGALLRLADGSAWAVGWEDGSPSLTATDPPPRAREPGMLPDGGIALGTGVIRRAWFAEPTEEYGHAILGDGIEAKALAIETADGALLTLRAPQGTVFEDLTPRLWDLDADGEAEAWVIRAGPREGARLEAYAIHQGEFILRFATDPIGQGYRWLNPVGVADFTGDGQREVALVQTPHIGGILTLYRPAGVYLERVMRVPGFSNHAIGSRALGLSWIGDIDGDGAADILLPGQSRRELAAFGMADGGFRILGASERTGHIETGFAALQPETGGRVIVFADDTPSLRWLRLPE